ncbi:thioesterase-like superfamily-domain-containing protein [Aspergillus spinulosporus]
MASRGPTPSLLEATSALSPENGSPDRFIARISRDWCTQHSVLGGYLTALMLSAARRFINNAEAVAKYPDPIHVFIQFLHKVPPGQISVSCKILRATARQCVVKVDLTLSRESEPGHGEAQRSPACISIATFADIDKEKGLTQGSTQSKPLGAHQLPSRETDCVTIDDPVVDATPVTRKLHWVAPRSTDGLWGHRLGGHQREVWLSFRDGSPISDLLHLALLADMPLQPPATHIAGFYSRHALSTLCLSVEFKKRPDPSTKWVLVRSNSHRVVDGRYDVNVQILDEGGEILALSNHVVYISDLRKSSKSANI